MCTLSPDLSQVIGATWPRFGGAFFYVPKPPESADSIRRVPGVDEPSLDPKA
jgi:hypothetical protein